MKALNTHDANEKVAVHERADAKVGELEDTLHNPHDGGGEVLRLVVEGSHDEGHVAGGLVVVYDAGTLLPVQPHLPRCAKSATIRRLYSVCNCTRYTIAHAVQRVQLLADLINKRNIHIAMMQESKL